MPIKVSRIPIVGVAVIEHSGELTGGIETERLRSAINELSAGGNKRLVIDFGKTTYLDSTAIGVLTWALTRYSKNEGEVKLANIPDNIKNVFVMTRLTMVFDVQSTQEDAIASFGGIRR